MAKSKYPPGVRHMAAFAETLEGFRHGDDKRKP
jgi:hypothetical protein